MKLLVFYQVWFTIFHNHNFYLVYDLLFLTCLNFNYMLETVLNSFYHGGLLTSKHYNSLEHTL